MRHIPDAPGFNKRAHEEEHDEETTGIGIKQSPSTMGDTTSRYFYPWVAAEINHVIIANGQMKAVPHWIGRTTTIDSIAETVSTGGSAGAVVRLGLYKGDESYGWFPKELIIDAGTVATTAIGTAEITGLGLVVEGGSWYWTAAAPQGAPVTQAEVDCFSPYTGGGGAFMNTLFASIFGSTLELETTCGLFINSVTGALPDPWTLDAGAGFLVDDVNIIKSYYSVLGAGNGGS